jgi:large subunit ribosomal protein L24
MARRAIGGRGSRKKRTPVRKMHVRKGDRVRIVRGAFAGKEGTVLRAIPKENRVVIEGVNLRKRHMGPSASNPEGGIVTFEAPLHASNVMLIDPQTDEPTRTRRQTDAMGMVERIAVKSGKVIPVTRS